MSTNVLAFKPKGADLDVADDRTYSDYITQQGFRDGKVWVLLLEPERIDRTLELLVGTKASIEQQLGEAKTAQAPGYAGWRKRTLNLLRMVNTYLTDVKGEIKDLDNEEREGSAVGERDEWRRICGLLVDLLADNPALGLITMPTSGGITAAEWSQLRATKSAYKHANTSEEGEIAA
jgi:hypothetical protein